MFFVITSQFSSDSALRLLCFFFMMPRRIVNFIVLITYLVVDGVDSQTYFPILLWHSAGETCCGHESNLYANFIESELGREVIIKSVKIGDSKEDDFANSLTMHPFEQINYVCNKLKQNSIYRDGYNAIGLSQGALLLRGLAQTCPFPPMKNLISLSGPHQGVNQYPRCEQMWGSSHCELLKYKINFKVYFNIFQRALTPATYWHDVNEERYKRGSTFLAVINNENHCNAEYVKNLQSLRRLVLVKYADDISLIPNESTWFGYYDKHGGTLPMEGTDVYRKDKLGLKKLLKEGKLIRLESPLDHLKLDENWFRQNIVPILKEK